MGLCVCVRYASKLPLFYNQLGLNRMPLMLTTTSGVKRMNTYILNTLNMRRDLNGREKLKGQIHDNILLLEYIHHQNVFLRDEFIIFPSELRRHAISNSTHTHTHAHILQLSHGKYSYVGY